MCKIIQELNPLCINVPSPGVSLGVSQRVQEAADGWLSTAPLLAKLEADLFMLNPNLNLSFS